MVKSFTLSLAFFNFLIAGEFLINGNFEDSLCGWNPYAQAETYIINTDKTYEDDPDSEVFVGRLDRLVTAVYQTCHIPTLELDLSYKAKIVAVCSDTSHPAPAVASIILSYLDIDENILGETRIFNWCDTLYWTPSSTLHLIEVNDTSWFSDTINILNELQNLPGINSQEISRLRISLYCWSNGC